MPAGALTTCESRRRPFSPSCTRLPLWRALNHEQADGKARERWAPRRGTYLQHAHEAQLSQLPFYRWVWACAHGAHGLARRWSIDCLHNGSKSRRRYSRERSLGASVCRVSCARSCVSVCRAVVRGSPSHSPCSDSKLAVNILIGVVSCLMILIAGGGGREIAGTQRQWVVVLD